MKRLIASVVAAVLLLPAGGVSVAQMQDASAQKSLSATMNVYVFPAKGQAPDQQSQDEVECYNWAVQNTGTDPFDLAKQAEQQKQQTEQQMAQAEQQKQQADQVGAGAGASGAVKGAAAGALIGEIANDDAGKGAAYGAAAGLIAGRRRGRQAQAQAQAQADKQAEQVEKQGEQKQAATQEQLTNFKKAFSVCLEAKEYMVKY